MLCSTEISMDLGSCCHTVVFKGSEDVVGMSLDLLRGPGNKLQEV